MPPILHAALALLALAAAPAAAQTASTLPPAPPDTLAVSLLTMLPGQEVYSLFGHSAVRVRSEARGLDRTYNFGTFDFDQPFFLARFARGQLDYILDTAPFADEIAKYVYLQRPVIEQRLALSPAAAEALLADLDRNALPENRAYRYDFFFDNCSTRLLDLLDRAAGGPGRVVLAPAAETPTFRELLYRNTRGAPTVALGMDLALGTPADRRATAREQTFLPVGLADALDRATVDGRPLVASRDTLFWVPGAGQVPQRTEPVVPAFVALLGLGWGLAALRPARFARAGRIADVVLFGVTGAMGVVFLFLWLGTDHTVTGPNLNVLWAFPGHLALAWAARRRPLSAPWRTYAAVAALGGVAALAVHASGVQSLPIGGLLLAAVVAGRAAWLAFRDETGRRGAVS